MQHLDALDQESTLESVPHASRRYSAERACAVRLSECAKVDATPAIVLEPSAVQWITDERLMKSYTPRGDAKRAVPDVGKTWFGPAQ